MLCIVRNVRRTCISAVIMGARVVVLRWEGARLVVAHRSVILASWVTLSITVDVSLATPVPLSAVRSMSVTVPHVCRRGSVRYATLVSIWMMLSYVRRVRRCCLSV